MFNLSRIFFKSCSLCVKYNLYGCLRLFGDDSDGGQVEVPEPGLRSELQRDRHRLLQLHVPRAQLEEDPAGP